MHRRISRSLPCLASIYSAVGFSLNHSPIEHGTLTGRREIFRQLLPIVAATTAFPPDRSFALGEGDERMVFKKKPTAPVTALLPAIQQRLILEAALDLLLSPSDDSPMKSPVTKIAALKVILPPIDENNRIRNDNGRQNSQILRKYPADKQLRGDTVRAAMNVYQLNLDYSAIMSASDAVQITDPDWKKSYIRANDGIPDIKKIVGADVDMRQLLRNQVELKIDDASAELWADDCDLQELTFLLQGAAQNFDLWLARVRQGDVQDAIRRVQTGKLDGPMPE